MAARLAPGEYDQLHHFIADGVWDAAPLEAELLVQADRLVGGKEAVLIIDDTAMPKKGDRSVGVLHNMPRLSARRPIAKHLVKLPIGKHLRDFFSEPFIRHIRMKPLMPMLLYVNFRYPKWK